MTHNETSESSAPDDRRHSGPLAIDAGLNVVLSNSRGPDTLIGLVTELGPSARAAKERLAGH